MQTSCTARAVPLQGTNLMLHVEVYIEVETLYHFHVQSYIQIEVVKLGQYLQNFDHGKCC